MLLLRARRIGFGSVRGDKDPCGATGCVVCCIDRG